METLPLGRRSAMGLGRGALPSPDWTFRLIFSPQPRTHNQPAPQKAGFFRSWVEAAIAEIRPQTAPRRRVRRFRLFRVGFHVIGRDALGAILRISPPKRQGIA